MYFQKNYFHIFKPLIKRGFFFKIFLSIVFFIFVLPINIKPVYSFSTINSCSTNPACASVAFTQTGGKAILKKKASDLVVKTTTKSAVNLTKGTVGRTTIKSLGEKTFILGVGGYIADKIFGHVIDDGIDAIQDKIKNYYCSKVSESFCGVAGVKITTYITAFNGARYVFYYSPRTIGFEQGNVVDAGEGAYQRYTSILPQGYDQYRLLEQDQNGDFYIAGGGGGGYWSDIEPEFEPFNIGGVDWDDWEEADKDKAIDEYLKDKPGELFEDLFDTTPVNHPPVESGDEVLIDADFHINPGGDGFDSGDDNFIEGEETTDPDPDPDPDLNCDNPDAPNYDPTSPDCSNEEPPEEEKVDCIECDDITFTQKNFFLYAQEKFIDDPRFPFDIFGDLPTAASANQCPTVELFDMSKELCFINDSLAILKYPVWIAWMFRLVFSI